MKTPAPPQSATSLKGDAAGRRFAKYVIMMTVRIACLIAMVLVTPYGWYTWLFGVGAVFLPYLAVVVANVNVDAHEPERISPDRAIDAPSSAPAPESSSPQVIRIVESRQLPPGAAP